MKNKDAQKEEKKLNKQKEMMLNGIVEIGKIAYTEEQERKKLLIEQSNSMIIVITLLITLLGIVLPFIEGKFDSKYISIVYVFFGSVISILLASLICCCGSTMEI